MDSKKKSLLTMAGFGEAVAKVEQGLCPFCNNPVKEEDFTSPLTKKEFTLSGMCEKCQDNFFE